MDTNPSATKKGSGADAAPPDVIQRSPAPIQSRRLQPPPSLYQDDISARETLPCFEAADTAAGIIPSLLTADDERAKALKEGDVEDDDGDELVIGSFSPVANNVSQTALAPLVSSGSSSMPKSVSAAGLSTYVARSVVVPCFNYSLVYRDVHRSAHPNPRNKEFMKDYLRLKSILCFCYEDHKKGKYPQEMVDFYKEAGIRLIFVYLESINEPFAFPMHHVVVSRVLSIVMNVHHHPVLMHCEYGNHQTGLICACLRKAQQWSLSSIYAEFTLFNGGKQNLMVQRFVDLYAPMVVTSDPTALASWMLSDYDFQYIPPTTVKAASNSNAKGEQDGSSIDAAVTAAPASVAELLPLHSFEVEALQRCYSTSAVGVHPGATRSAPLQIVVVLPPEPLPSRVNKLSEGKPHSTATGTSSGFGSIAYSSAFPDGPILSSSAAPPSAITTPLDLPTSVLGGSTVDWSVAGQAEAYLPITAVAPRAIAKPALSAFLAAGGGEEPVKPKKDKKPKA